MYYLMLNFLNMYTKYYATCLCWNAKYYATCLCLKLVLKCVYKGVCLRHKDDINNVFLRHCYALPTLHFSAYVQVDLLPGY